jgi:ankyrin repeat protein
MSKYLGSKPNFLQNTNTEGQPTLKPTIDDETKNFILSNISSGNYTILFDKITPNINLTFNDNDNNSVVHILLNVDNKLIPEKTKVKLLQFFIRRGAPINTYNKNRLTPLHIAIKNGDSEIVQHLLKIGANPNAETYNKVTPIQLALKINTSVCRDNIIPKSIGDI